MRARDLVLRVAGVVLTLGASYFVLRANVFYSSPEDCHTGAVAADILAHGPRFPLSSYTPEVYELGIVVAGLLTVPFFRVLGPNELALELLPFLVSVVTVVAGLALLERVLPARTDRRFVRVAQLAYVAFFAAAPLVYVAISLSPVGDHHEGAALSLLVFVLAFREAEAPGRARFAVLWLAAGTFAWWEKGVLLAVGVVAAALVLSAWRARALRAVAAAAALFLVGYAPGLCAHYATGLADAGAVAGKFDPFALLHGLGTWAVGLWVMLDRNPVLALAIVVATGLVVPRVVADLRARRATPVALLGVYTAAAMLVVVAAPGVHLPYHDYVIPLLALGYAVGVARVARVLARRVSWPVAGAVAITLSVVCAWPAIAPDWHRPATMLADTGHAVCAWRFGRAFRRRARDLAGAAALCRRLDGEHALACVAGLGLDRREGELGGGSADERRSFAFGVGQSMAHGESGGHGAPPADPCGAFPDDADRAACALGTTVECLTYADLIQQLLVGARLPRPRCELPDPPCGEYPATLVHDLRGRSPTGRGPSRDVVSALSRTCRVVVAGCYPEPSERTR